jgi:Protein of unknown function (DUF2840)
MLHGLSGTARLGRSGTERSYYREPKRVSNPHELAPNFALNLANKESFGFLLTQGHLGTDSDAPPNRPAETRVRANPQLTDVTLVWRQGEREDWLKFGKPIAERIIDRRQRIESYAAGQVFGLVRWASNDYGTIRSAFDIVHAVDDDGPRVPVPQVDPGGEVLLSVRGWPKVSQVFRLIDAIEASGIDPCDVAHDHWRHIHNRMAGREVPRGYSPARHRAWLQRKALLT